MEVERIAQGLWRWTARHPDWTHDEDWPEEVGCVYYEGPRAVFLIDPLVPAEANEEERFWQALDRDLEQAGRRVAVLRTVHWHHRSIDEVLARYRASPGAILWTRASGGPPPAGVEAYAVERADETLFWIPEHRALVTGDVLIGADDSGLRVCPDSWLPRGAGGTAFRASLHFLLDLPIEMVLLSHGRPVLANGREVLAAALS